MKQKPGSKDQAEIARPEWLPGLESEKVDDPPPGRWIHQLSGASGRVLLIIGNKTLIQDITSKFETHFFGLSIFKDFLVWSVQRGFWIKDSDSATGQENGDNDEAKTDIAQGGAQEPDQGAEKESGKIDCLVVGGVSIMHHHKPP